MYDNKCNGQHDDCIYCSLSSEQWNDCFDRGISFEQYKQEVHVEECKKIVPKDILPNPYYNYVEPKEKEIVNE